jgi:hypothetical protein
MGATERQQIIEYVSVESSARGSLRSCRIVDVIQYDGFRIEAHKGALGGGFGSPTASKIVAAMTELCSNVLEHSGAPDSGVVAFRAADKLFEFVVIDKGVGPLDSLRTCDAFAHLSDHGEALGLMMEEGVSRFGKGVGRGFGYRPLFIWLANLTGHLRFRAGDHAFELDGRFGDQLAIRLSQKPQLQGYFASVSCIG